VAPLAYTQNKSRDALYTASRTLPSLDLIYIDGASKNNCDIVHDFTNSSKRTFSTSEVVEHLVDSNIFPNHNFITNLSLVLTNYTLKNIHFCIFLFRQFTNYFVILLKILFIMFKKYMK